MTGLKTQKERSIPDRGDKMYRGRSWDERQLLETVRESDEPKT